MFKLDTGSQVNVIPKSELLKWHEKPVVRNCKIAVLDYSDNRVPTLGECYLNCETKRFIYRGEEHCKLLRRTLLKARKANLKFNVLKTHLSQTSVNYLGHGLSDEGIKPNPKKIRALEEFATPNCKEDLQRFLGMVTYLAKFTPHLSNLTHNLSSFLKKDFVWTWDTKRGI
ncbi:transposon Tf2-9 polyprotein [Trichonephila inaurata madagascariensis]|uniref:Transposon Tf2-9 polyprotein n=1 Tax=Trichonephila inaurata madagascariensis TaxID=2747483 RepID=A0A8X6XHJ5_9ARAC|nr:transposon Tf2-9 polyprotein [Trichonephila inaurata madagascariensis]